MHKYIYYVQPTSTRQHKTNQQKNRETNFTLNKKKLKISRIDLFVLFTSVLFITSKIYLCDVNKLWEHFIVHVLWKTPFSLCSFFLWSDFHLKQTMYKSANKYAF
uniref:Uncharacterized protein n=1 Tax=Cacopsylla melanoneura TaxID=428564 RepID=A0A8D8VR02_9HEMI